MPELPEAETIARGLDRALRGSIVERVEVRRRKNLIAPRGMRVDRLLRKERIERVGRRGKYVVVFLGSGRRLIVQLRMTGRLLVLRPAEPAPPSSRIVIRTTGGGGIAFADVRKLGRVQVVEAHEAWDAALGLEPLAPGFTVEAFAAMLAGRTTPIKVLLLDQRRIAGIGNIYACEALWESGIRPARAAGAVTKAAARRLHRAIVDVLTRAIDLRGSSIDDYVDADGGRGGFQNALRVYGKRGKPCPRCGSPIVRTVLAARGTWWCRRCQR
jgi:formamidopyrimidine-DNA glycosylase